MFICYLLCVSNNQKRKVPSTEISSKVLVCVWKTIRIISVNTLTKTGDTLVLTNVETVLVNEYKTLNTVPLAEAVDSYNEEPYSEGTSKRNACVD